MDSTMAAAQIDITRRPQYARPASPSETLVKIIRIRAS